MASKYPTMEAFLVDLIRRLDKNGSGFIEFEELCAGLKEMDFNLSY